MKGVLRKVDGLGRISLPKSFRSFHGIENEEQVEIINTSKGVLVRKANYEEKPLMVAVDILDKEIKYTSNKNTREELERIKQAIKKLGT